MIKTYIIVHDDAFEDPRGYWCRRADVEPLFAKLIEIAESCAECDGTGVITEYRDHTGLLICRNGVVGPEDKPTLARTEVECSECIDIRELLA